MRRPLLAALVVVIVVLAAATAVLVQKNQKASASFAESETRYGHAIDAIAEIQDSLNAIVVGDSSVTALSRRLDSEQHLTQSQSQAAMERISIINASIQRTKTLIAALEERLQKTGLRVASLTRMVNGLKKNVAAKEAMIAGLSGRVDSLQTTVAGLQTDVQAKQEQIVAKDQTIEDRRRELATVYYVVGTKKALETSGVVVAKGGLLGIGKTMALTGTYKDSLFTPMDTDQMQTVETPAAKVDQVQVLSAQASSSYELTMTGDKVQLRILDPVEFRKVRHLVIVTG